jgi:anti-sigma B factor antagonist
MSIVSEALPGGILKINLSGRLDIAGVKDIEVPLAEMVAVADKAVIVDITEVGYLASTGIRALLLAAKDAGKRGKWFAVLHPEQNVAKVLNTTGIDRIIPVHETLPQALAAFASEQR